MGFKTVVLESGVQAHSLEQRAKKIVGNDAFVWLLSLLFLLLLLLLSPSLPPPPPLSLSLSLSLSISTSLALSENHKWFDKKWSGCVKK